MKAHSNDFKLNVAHMGKQHDSIISYELNGETVELGIEDLNSVTPHYKADILKSAMKQLDIDSSIDIPLGTEINYQFGVKVGDDYEYLNYGNYIVYSSEKQEDLRSYKIVAYDKMLYSMKDYESLGITYPITIRNYINAICTHLGLTFKNANDTFPNYNRQIQSELYLDSEGNSMGYKFRDVLDELAQATASTICINENDDELEVRYITETNDTINEDFFKDINVKFGEKYGPVNSIVLSRSSGTDNVYLQDQQSIEQNGLCEIKITDNQIMNWNDRADYLPDLLSKLDGLEYYLNDYSSPGITYYDLCDRYTILIDNNYYSCVMLNDEINVTKGLEENIYTERPLPSETDYSKADKTDRKINQTYLIVDKQNQTIQSVVSNVTEQDQKISQITQTVNEINSKISDIADITTSAEDTDAKVELQEINTSEPIQIKIHPTGTNISYLYPRDNLYPSDTLYMPDRRIRFHNLTTDENFDFILPDDLLYYDSEHYDEFLLDYGDGTPQTQICQITKKCKFNADGTVSLLSDEETTNYTYPTIPLTDGNYEVSIYGYQQGYIFTRLIAKNIYTSQFYTKVETNSLINQTASSINLSVDQKLSNYSTTTEMNSAITLKANEINSVVATKVGNNEVISKINQSAEQVQIDANKISLAGKQINLTSDNISIDSGNFSVDTNGNASMKGAIINNGTIQVDSGEYNSRTKLGVGTLGLEISSLTNSNNKSILSHTGLSVDAAGTNVGSFLGSDKLLIGQISNEIIQINGNTGEIKCAYVTQTSKEENKKDFEKLENALEIIKNTDIYKYHFQNQKIKEKKHIGFVIGNNYKYSKEITSQDNDGVDLYSMIGVCFKAIQEQQKEIERLKEELKK